MSEIHTAVERGHSSRVEEILRTDSTAVNSRDTLGNQPLHLAAWQGRAALAKTLLDGGADINAKGDLGRTALHYAVANRRRKVLTLLLERGADPSIVDDLGAAPLYLAASTEDRVMCETLLRAGTRMDSRSAIYLEGPAAVLERQVAGRESIDPTRAQQLLWDAVRVGSADLVTYLLEKGADVNNSSVGGLAPLLQAISVHRADIVRLLLDLGADVGVKDHVGQPILKFCGVYGAGPEIIRLLKERGAKE